VDASWSCVEGKGDPAAAAFFEQQGLPGYLEPALGYHAMLCGAGASSRVCTLGVAGLAAHALPECVAAE
jgi:hypothetical protein